MITLSSVETTRTPNVRRMLSPEMSSVSEREYFDRELERLKPELLKVLPEAKEEFKNHLPSLLWCSKVLFGIEPTADELLSISFSEPMTTEVPPTRNDDILDELWFFAKAKLVAHVTPSAERLSRAWKDLKRILTDPSKPSANHPGAKPGYPSLSAIAAGCVLFPTETRTLFNHESVKEYLASLVTIHANKERINTSALYLGFYTHTFPTQPLQLPADWDHQMIGWVEKSFEAVQYLPPSVEVLEALTARKLSFATNIIIEEKETVIVYPEQTINQHSQHSALPIRKDI